MQPVQNSHSANSASPGSVSQFAFFVRVAGVVFSITFAPYVPGAEGGTAARGRARLAKQHHKASCLKTRRCKEKGKAWGARQRHLETARVQSLSNPPGGVSDS